MTFLIEHALALILAAAAANASAAAPSLPATEPHYRAPVTLGDTIPLPPLQLLGLRLVQKGVELEDDRPTLAPDALLEIVAYWQPTIRMESSVPIEIVFWDYLNLISQMRAFRAGPDANAAVWEPGSVYSQRYTVAMEDVAAQLSGHGYLVLSRKEQAGATPPVPCQVLEVSVQPLTVSSSLSAAQVDAAFPGAKHHLGAHLRMGYGSDGTLTVPADWPTARRLGIISSLSYQSVPGGRPVCRIVINDAETDSLTVPLLAGSMTTRCDYDQLRPAERDHQRPPIFSSRDSAMVDRDGRPMLLHTYAGTIELERPIDVRTLRFICESETILDIYGVVVLPD